MAPKVAKSQRINYSLPKNAISRDYRITRSRLPAGSHVSIAYEGKKATCIVCRKMFLTKDVLKHHYEQAHQALPETQARDFTNKVLPPFAHPSCWPAPVKLTRRQNENMAEWRQRMDDADTPDPRYDSASVVQEYNDQYKFADIGARNEKEYKEIKDVQEYRIWNWWLEQQDIDMGAALENEEANIRTNTDSGAMDRKRQLESNTYHQTATLPVAPQYAQEVYDKSHGKTGPSGGSKRYAELYWVAERAAGVGGRLTTDYELPTRGPLKPTAILQSLADANMAFVDQNGETAESRHTMAIAAEKFLTAIGAQPHLDQLQQLRNSFRNKDFRQERDVSQMGTRELAIREKKQNIWYMSEFRRDRARIFDIIEDAVEEHFGQFPDIKIRRPGGPFNTIVLAAYEYAQRLQATAVMAMINRYFAGHGEGLVTYLDNRYGEGQR